MNAKSVIAQILVLCFLSCESQSKKEAAVARKKNSDKVKHTLEIDPAIQVSQYIRRMHQDKKGNLWFGTNGDGLAVYNGDTLLYYSVEEGLGGTAVRGFAQDVNGVLWIATDGGLSRYNSDYSKNPCVTGKCRHTSKVEDEWKHHSAERSNLFTNFTMMDGLANNQLWSILCDKKGNLWLGTEGGVSRYDGKSFTKFNLPVPDISKFPETYPSAALVSCIFEDKVGDIWFSTNGGGIYRYDGNYLGNLTEADGLCNNFVQCIQQDSEGNMWIGTRFGGISFLDIKGFPANKYSFNTYTLNFKMPDGSKKSFVWTFFEDKSERLWIGTAGGGLYCYMGMPSKDGIKRFQKFGEKEGLPNKFIQSILQDKNGKIWIGSSGGLFRYDEEKKYFTNITKNGPWK